MHQKICLDTLDTTEVVGINNEHPQGAVNLDAGEYLLSTIDLSASVTHINTGRIIVHRY